jgi:hypothetical protein
VDRYIPSRVYLARVIIDTQNIPNLENPEDFKQETVALKVLVVMGKSTDKNYEVLKGLSKAAEVIEKDKIFAKQKLRVLPILITKTDGL